MVQPGHRIEGVGDHPHSLGEGGAGLSFCGVAVAEAHQDAQLLQRLDHVSGSGQFRRQSDQRDLPLEAGDALVQALQAWCC